jgi:hypothetical protein
MNISVREVGRLDARIRKCYATTAPPPWQTRLFAAETTAGENRIGQRAPTRIIESVSLIERVCDNPKVGLLLFCRLREQGLGLLLRLGQ